MPEETYQVLLVHLDANAVDGLHVYRGERLPEPNEIITVEQVLSPVPLEGTPTRRARVSRVTPDDRFPIHATELKA